MKININLKCEKASSLEILTQVHIVFTSFIFILPFDFSFCKHPYPVNIEATISLLLNPRIHRSED